MSVEIASLLIEVDATPADRAASALDKMTAAGGRAESAAKRIKNATDKVTQTYERSVSAYQKAAQGADAYARAEGTIARASLGAASAARENRAARALEAAAMREVVLATRAYERDQVSAAKASAAAISSLEARIDSLKGSIDPTYGAQKRLNAEMAEATALYKMGAISGSDYAKAVGLLDAKMAEAARGQVMLNGVMVRGAGSAKFMQRAGLDLSRQFADIGVTAAMGMNPIMILIQQGPQIADIFAQGKAQGVGFSAMLGMIGAQAAPLIAILGPILLVVGAIGGAFAIAAQQINSENKNLIDTLGLTEAQLERVKNKSVTMGDVMKGTFNAAAKALSSAFAPEIAAVKSAFQTWYDDLLVNTVKEVKTIVGAFIGAYEAIKATWSMLPAAMGDVAISAVNLTLKAIEGMINKAVDLINGVIGGANTIAGKVGLDITVPTLDHAKFAEISNQYAGAMKATAEAGTEGFAAGMARGAAVVDKALAAITRETLAAYEARVRKEAKKAAKEPKGPATPRDQTDERSAQIDGMLEAAKAEELQAQLSLTKETRARVEIEKQIAAAQLAIKQAQIARQMANIADDKGLSDATKAELGWKLIIVAQTYARAGALQRRAIEERALETLAKEQFSVRKAEAEAQIRVLASQEGTAEYEYQRREISLERLKLEQQLERAGLEQVTIKNGATETEVKIAKALLDRLALIQGNETKAANGTAQDTFRRVESVMNEVARAFEAHDWNSVVRGLIEAFGNLKQAFSKAGTIGDKIGAVAGVANIAGQAIGGRAGSALSGAATGAMAGFQLGGPVGAGIGAIVGGISGLLSGNKAKKREKEEQARQKAEAEATRLMNIANERRDLELQILELSGDTVGALAKVREAELAAVDGTNRALLEQVHALQDVKRITEERAALEIRLMEATGNAAAVLARKRADELKSLDAVNRHLAMQVYAQEDVNTARDNLSAAYERESSALQATIDKFKDFSAGLKKFRDSLYSGPAAMLSPEEQYKASKALFQTTASRAQGGDESAIRDLESVSQAYLDASKDYYASSAGYFADLEAVRGAVTATQRYAASQVDSASAQLDALKQSVSGILNVELAVLSVRDALAAYHAALAAQTELAKTPTAPITQTPTTPTTQTENWASYMTKNTDVMAEYLRNVGSAKGGAYLASLGISTAEQFGAWHWNKWGKSEGRTPFATGGEATVGGSGGVDSQAFGPMRLTPGEIINIRRPGEVANDNREVVAELRAVKAELVAVKRELQADKAQRAAMDAAAEKRTDAMLDGLSDVKKAARAGPAK